MTASAGQCALLHSEVSQHDKPLHRGRAKQRQRGVLSWMGQAQSLQREPLNGFVQLCFFHRFLLVSDHVFIFRNA